MNQNSGVLAKALLAVSLMCSFSVFAAGGKTTVVGGKEFHVPDFIVQSDAEEKFEACIVDSMKVRGLSEENAREAILETGGVEALYRAILADFQRQPPRRASRQRKRSEDPALLMDAIEAAAFGSLDGIFAAFDQSRIRARLRIAQAEALDLRCEIPEHLLPGGDPKRSWALDNRVLIDEYLVFNDCVSRRFDSKFAERRSEGRLGKLVDAETLSKVRLTIAKQIMLEGFSDDDWAKRALESQDIDDQLASYTVVMSIGFDIRLSAKAGVLNSYLMNRYLDLGCAPEPSRALLEFAGYQAD